MSWKDPKVQRLAAEPGVFLVQGPMCRWGMTVHNQHGEKGFARKETKWLTNSLVLAEILSGVCPNQDTNNPSEDWHRHIRLISGTLRRQAQVYPVRLVKAVL